MSSSLLHKGIVRISKFVFQPFLLLLSGSECTSVVLFTARIAPINYKNVNIHIKTLNMKMKC